MTLDLKISTRNMVLTGTMGKTVKIPCTITSADNKVKFTDAEPSGIGEKSLVFFDEIVGVVGITARKRYWLKGATKEYTLVLDPSNVGNNVVTITTGGSANMYYVATPCTAQMLDCTDFSVKINPKVLPRKIYQNRIQGDPGRYGATDFQINTLNIELGGFGFTTSQCLTAEISAETKVEAGKETYITFAAAHGLEYGQKIIFTSGTMPGLDPSGSITQDKVYWCLGIPSDKELIICDADPTAGPVNIIKFKSAKTFKVKAVTMDIPYVAQHSILTACGMQAKLVDSTKENYPASPITYFCARDPEPVSEQLIFYRDGAVTTCSAFALTAELDASHGTILALKCKGLGVLKTETYEDPNGSPTKIKYYKDSYPKRMLKDDEAYKSYSSKGLIALDTTQSIKYNRWKWNGSAYEETGVVEAEMVPKNISYAIGAQPRLFEDQREQFGYYPVVKIVDQMATCALTVNTPPFDAEHNPYDLMRTKTPVNAADINTEWLYDPQSDKPIVTIEHTWGSTAGNKIKASGDWQISDAIDPVSNDYAEELQLAFENHTGDPSTADDLYCPGTFAATFE